MNQAGDQTLQQPPQQSSGRSTPIFGFGRRTPTLSTNGEPGASSRSGKYMALNCGFQTIFHSSTKTSLSPINPHKI
jgi:hypothetical protein